METEKINKLMGSEKLRSLLKKRMRVIYLLTGAAVVQYCSYFLAIAYAPTFMGTTWPQGSSISIVIWLTVVIVLMSILLSGVYIWWANKYYDPEKEALIKEMMNE